MKIAAAVQHCQVELCVETVQEKLTESSLTAVLLTDVAATSGSPGSSLASNSLTFAWPTASHCRCCRKTVSYLAERM